jgi:hypothetical protein
MLQRFVLMHNEHTQRRDRHGFSPCSHFIYPAVKKAGPEYAFISYQRTEWKNSIGLSGSQGKYMEKSENSRIGIIPKTCRTRLSRRWRHGKRPSLGIQGPFADGKIVVFPSPLLQNPMVLSPD